MPKKGTRTVAGKGNKNNEVPVVMVMGNVVSLSFTACWVCCRRTVMTDVKPDGARLATGRSGPFYSNAAAQRRVERDQRCTQKSHFMSSSDTMGSCQVQR